MNKIKLTLNEWFLFYCSNNSRTNDRNAYDIWHENKINGCTLFCAQTYHWDMDIKHFETTWKNLMQSSTQRTFTHICIHEPTHEMHIDEIARTTKTHKHPEKRYNKNLCSILLAIEFLNFNGPCVCFKQMLKSPEKL